MKRAELNEHTIEAIRIRGDRIYSKCMEFFKVIQPKLKDKTLTTTEITGFFPGVVTLRVWDALSELEDIGALKGVRYRKGGGKRKRGCRPRGLPNRWTLDNIKFFEDKLKGM